MIGNNSDRNVFFIFLAVLTACDLAHLISDSLDGINIKDRINALHKSSKSFKAHTCVDILLFQRSIGSVLVSFKLCENKVPELHISVAIAAYRTIRFTASVLLTTIKIDLRAGTTGTVCSCFPEIVFLAHAENMIHRYTDFFVPDLFGFVIIFVYRDIQSFLWKLQHLRNILPRPGNSLVFKIISKGEITQHFKICTMPCCLTDILDIACSDTFLAGSHSCSGRYLLTCKIWLQRCHTCNNKQKTVIILRYQRIALVPQTVFAFKEFQIRFSQIIQTCPFHFIFLRFYKEALYYHQLLLFSKVF